jgi:hypothetical protein
MKSLLRRIASRFERDDERGLAVIWFALTIGVFIIMAAFTVDLIHAYVEQAAAQKAADAAALAGAAEIPNDPSGGLAQQKAIELANDNGFTLAPADAPKPTSNTMSVEVSETFDTFFGGLINIPKITVHGTAEAIYDAPVKMGSPANNLGDVPACPPGVSAPCVNPAANAAQNLFAQVEGQGAGKTNGNSYTTQNCSNAQTDGCTGTGTGGPPGGPQMEYDGNGELVLIHSDGAPTDVYLYDAPYVSTGVGCTSGTPPLYASEWDPITNVAMPGDTFGTNSFCSGDNVNTSLNPAVALETKYELYSPSPTGNPKDALNASPLCSLDAKGYTDPDAAFQAGNNLSDLTIKQTFHQWYKLPCQAGGAGDYVLRVYGPRANDVGANAYSVLALQAGQPGTARVFMQKQLPLYAQTTPGNTSEFYVARVLPSPGRTRSLVVDLFDFGDSSCNGSCPSRGKIQLKWFTNNTLSSISGCQWIPPPVSSGAGANGAPPNDGDPNVGLISTDEPGLAEPSTPSSCTWRYASGPSGSLAGNWNARWVSLVITVPSTYNCLQGVQTDCWLKMQVTPDPGGTAAMSDATTWYAHMNGSPVALLK